MKCVKNTITSTNLNTGNVQEIDTSLTTEIGVVKIPSEILIVNNTGANLGLIFLDSDAEKAVWTANPSMFDYLPIVSGKSAGILPTSIKYIEIKLLSGSCSSNLDIYVFNYIYLDN
jgi:hypothetical protein